MNRLGVLLLALLLLNLSLKGFPGETVEPLSAPDLPSGRNRTGVAGDLETGVLKTGRVSEEAFSGHRTFPVVPPEQIALDLVAFRMEKDEVGDEIKRKILSKFVPVRLTLHNKSDKLLNIPRDSVFLLDERGRFSPIPTEEDIFRKVKRNGVVRSLGWGLPLGAATFGILLIPAIVYSGVHTKVMNTGVKDNLAASAFHGTHINPEASVSTVVFIPKRQAGSVKKIVLDRVIDTEAERETRYVVDIQGRETDTHDAQK